MSAKIVKNIVSSLFFEKYSEKKDKETKIENKEEVKIQNINVIF